MRIIGLLFVLVCTNCAMQPHKIPDLAKTIKCDANGNMHSNGFILSKNYETYFEDDKHSSIIYAYQCMKDIKQ